MGRDEQRLRRQVNALTRGVPAFRSLMDSLIEGRLRLVRVPIGILLFLGGFLWFLPVLGLWMLPLGLLLLALDLPMLRPPVSAATIRARRRVRTWWRDRRSE
jgi:hypothetical protein